MENRDPSDANANLILTGFMGTGKTSVGRRVAEVLRRPFIDTDDVIAERAGKTIPEIFAEEGEPAFRQMERELCRELSRPAGLVIATGGGTLIDPANRQCLEAGGRVICLLVSPEEAAARTALADDRPLLDAPDRLARARAILQERDPIYRSFTWQVDTSGLDTEEVAERVLRLWRARRLPVHAPAEDYIIHIQEGVLDDAGRHVAHVGAWGTLVVVSNPTVWGLYGERLMASLRAAGLEAAPAWMPDGEEYKTLDTLASLYEGFLDAGLDRSGAVIALGGGVVGDVAGFAAATFMRGVPLIQVPTTFLAMIDASVGGKTAVDLPRGKNLVGAFHPPRLVLIDPLVLESLPARQVRFGLAEALKAGIIADPELFSMLSAGPPWPWVDIITRALRVKIDVVEEDPFEQGRRAVLNLGHTAGHALERLSAYHLPHGEAVAVGLMVAATMAEAMQLCPPDLPARIESALGMLGLPTAWEGDFTPADVLAAMAHDKKRRHGTLRWILPRDIGQVEIIPEVPEEIILEALARTRAYRPASAPRRETT